MPPVHSYETCPKSLTGRHLALQVVAARWSLPRKSPTPNAASGTAHKKTCPPSPAEAIEGSMNLAFVSAFQQDADCLKAIPSFLCFHSGAKSTYDSAVLTNAAIFSGCSIANCLSLAPNSQHAWWNSSE